MGPIFFEKNKLDLDLGSAVTCTITDGTASNTGQDVVDLMRNRNNRSGWGTVGSNDAANTEMLWELSDQVTIDAILLVKHNFKSYTIQYWNGSSFVDFSTAINVSDNATETTYHVFNDVSTNKIKLIITGTMTVDDDKYLRQFIATERLGQLASGFKIDNPRVSQERRQVKLLSGKSKIVRNLGAYSVRLSKNNVVSENDLGLLETCYELPEGFLVWLCGGDTSQFRTQRIGYRLEDIFLMDFKNDWEPEWDGGFYKHGTNVKLDLVEVV
jgi:hypothetical protein